MRSTLQKLFWIARPISWPNTAYPFAAAYIVAGGQLDLTFFIGTLYFLGPYNLLMYGINDVFDYESDIRNPRKGGIEGMREQKAFHPTIIRATLITNIPFILYLGWVGDTYSRLTLAVVLFFVVAYSIAKLRFKERPFLDSITSSAHFVGPMVFGLTLTTFHPQAWVYVIAFFLWGMASHAFGAVQDIIPDRKGNLASIATVLGARRTVWFAVTLYAVAAAILLAQAGAVAAIGAMGLLYIWNTARFYKITDAKSQQTNAGWRTFIWLNYATGFVVTMALIYYALS